MPTTDPSLRAAEVARASYGKLIAILSARSGDIMAAEDALADAFVQALKTWPVRGIPDNPEAWLMTAAKNRATDAVRRVTRGPIAHGVELPDIGTDVGTDDADTFVDRRLALLFVCAHPDIDAGIHTPLMLQTVLGLEAGDIARAFLQSPTAVTQRLVRAKRTIRDAHIPFSLPPADEQRQRLPAVLDAVYAAYTHEWISDDTARDLTNEALYLAELLAQLLPDAETAGLAALLAFTHARRQARLRHGVFVPIHEQDPSLWDRDLMARARSWLGVAATMKRLGRFQLEAAMQQAHGNPRVLLPLVDGLCALWPSAGAAVSRAAILGEAWGPAVGLSALDAIDGDLTGFQPAHATRAHLLARAGQTEQARAAYAAAIALTTSIPVRRWLTGQHDALGD
jgi:RNA polymerase sigma-70 factor (ECF subfamily)